MMKFVLFCALVSLASATIYTIITETSNVKNAETDNIYLRMTLIGAYANVLTPYFDEPDRDDFKKGASEAFVFSGLKEVGEIHCIDISVGGDDWWLFKTILVYSNTHPFPVIFENTSNQGMSSDSSEGVRNMRLCAGGGDISRK